MNLQLDSFTLSEFLAPLTLPDIFIVLMLGVIFGYTMSRAGLEWSGLLFSVMAALVFFLPVGLLRNLDGSTTWERSLGTGTLWLVYLVGREIGNQIYKRSKHG